MPWSAPRPDVGCKQLYSYAKKSLWGPWKITLPKLILGWYANCTLTPPKNWFGIKFQITVESTTSIVYHDKAWVIREEIIHFLSWTKSDIPPSAVILCNGRLHTPEPTDVYARTFDDEKYSYFIDWQEDCKTHEVPISLVTSQQIAAANFNEFIRLTVHKLWWIKCLIFLEIFYMQLCKWS